MKLTAKDVIISLPLCTIYYNARHIVSNLKIFSNSVRTYDVGSSQKKKIPNNFQIKIVAFLTSGYKRETNVTNILNVGALNLRL